MHSISVKASKHKRKKYVRVDNNLGNFPLARSDKTRPDLHLSEDDQEHHECKLPGDDRITVRLPLNVADDLKRCPNGFDTALLFLLMGETDFSKGTRLTFSSISSMLRMLDLPTVSANRERVLNSLRYWSVVAIRFEQWYHGSYTKHVFTIQTWEGKKFTRVRSGGDYKLQVPKGCEIVDQRRKTAPSSRTSYTLSRPVKEFEYTTRGPIKIHVTDNSRSWRGGMGTTAGFTRSRTLRSGRT